jgi:hypothetical protein
MQDASSGETDENGIYFAPLCTSLCFGKYSGCVHEQKKVQIDTVGQYVLFPSKWYHQGYYNDRSGMFFVTAQLFARPSISPDSSKSLRTMHSNDQMIESWLEGESISVLGSDILVNWDTTYSQQHFQPCKDFYGEVDKECNHQIPSTKFDQVPLIKKLVDQFCNLFPHLSIEQVWLIVKSKRGSGFQTWHRDFYLNDKITRTIVVNLGAMKRSDVPGKAFGHLSEFPPEETTLEERKQRVLLQPAAPSDLKSPPETITIREYKDSQELEEDLVEYHNEREDSNEDEEDLVEYHTERKIINLATNQESILTFAPILPHFPKRTVWICD